MPPVFTPTSIHRIPIQLLPNSSTTTHLHATCLHPHFTHRVPIQLLPIFFIYHHPPSCHPSSHPPHTPRSHSVTATLYQPPPTFMPPVFTSTSIHRIPIQLLPHYINHHPPSCHPSSPPPHTPRSHSVAATLYQPPPTFMPPVFTSTSYTAFPFSCRHIISTTTHLHAARLHLHLIHRVSIQLLLQQPVARFFIQALPALSKLTLGVGNGCMPSHMLHAK